TRGQYPPASSRCPEAAQNNRFSVAEAEVEAPSQVNFLQNEIGNGRRIIQAETRYVQTLMLRIARHRPDGRVAERKERLAYLCAIGLDLGQRRALEPLHQNQIDGCKFRQQVIDPRLVSVAQFVHEGPARGRRYQHLPRASPAVTITVTTGM